MTFNDMLNYFWMQGDFMALAGIAFGIGSWFVLLVHVISSLSKQ